ncbi:FAD-binding oxidoreductase [Actinomadura syzygii]|uniref:FAD-binding oxidoreductase n=1 Tax=Actinomadura syzygii TaxID=1427538 RepID=A0A5D0UB74_9ACTN|nr:FAD-binding oxidoreductase [Actinomadura syzygii]TYC15040.1 FAD-binding oxidoreductase [Actinomadura syzygii]
MLSRRKVLGAGALALLAPHPRSARPWARLARHLRGQLVLPWHPGYRTARQLDLAQYDRVNPAAVAYCADEADVALCLAFAQDERLPFAIRSGGHSFGGYSTSQGLLIDVSRLNSIAIGRDAAFGQGTVRIGTGAAAVDVLNALAPAGLVVPGGAFATVAAGGYIQGGGIGYLTRTFGLACDRVTSARVVLADGRTVTASRDQHPDLYWAIRGGGGGNFGVVTSFNVVPARLSTLSVATLTWDFTRAADMLDGFAHFLADAPRTVGAVAVVALGDGEPPWSGVVLISPGDLRPQVDALLSATGPASSQSIDVMSHQDFMLYTYGCTDLTQTQCHRIGTRQGALLPRTPFGLVRGRLFSRPPSRDMWEKALAVFDLPRPASVANKLEVLALGGADNDPARTDTAYVHRDTLFDLNYLSSVYRTPVPPEARAAATSWANAGFAAIDPHSNGETYQNFIDPSLPDWAHAYYAENHTRLTTVKTTYDPHNTFAFPQSIRA